jgi:hypothetical protein
MLLVRIDFRAVLQDEVYQVIEGYCWMRVDIKRFPSDKKHFLSISCKRAAHP